MAPSPSHRFATGPALSRAREREEAYDTDRAPSPACGRGNGVRAFVSLFTMNLRQPEMSHARI